VGRDAIGKIQRLLGILDAEIDSEESILDFLDNLEALASALAEYKLTPRAVRRAYSLDKVLKRIGKADGNAELRQLGESLSSELKETRRASYDSGDDDETVEDLVGGANELRERVRNGIHTWLEQHEKSRK